MGSYISTADQVFVGHLDLTSHANEIMFGPLERAMQTCTTFSDGGFVCVKPGLISGEAGVKGYQDFAADVLDDELSVAQLGSQYPVSWCPNDDGAAAAAGDPAWFSRGLVGLVNPLGAGAKGEMSGFEYRFPYDTAIVQGKVAAAKAAITADGNGTAVALTGPTASQSLYAAIHVTAYSGFTNVVFKIQSDDSSGMSSATDRITFTTVTGTTSEFASVAGNFSSETHHRITYDVTGSGSVTVFAVFGVI